MHGITTPIDVSLAHGVESVSEASEAEQEDVSASVSNQINLTNFEDVTPSTALGETSVDFTTVTNSEHNTLTTTDSIHEMTTITVDHIATNNTVEEKETNTKSQVEQPIDIPVKDKTSVETDKDKIAYDPEDMQGDAFPSIYSYGVQKLQYIKLLTKLKEVNEDLHINLDESVDLNDNLKKLHYDSEKTFPKVDMSTKPIATDVPITTTNVITTTDSPEEILFVTTNKFTAQSEHVTTTTPAPTIIINEDLLKTTKASLIEKSTVVADGITFNTAETKTPEATNPKHVLINLTIAADGAEDSAYKPIYSLTLTVPTLGDANESPTVKITPIEAFPTQPTNFNKPGTIEGTTKAKATNTEEWGGTCECSCPVCNNNSSDDFYDDYADTTTKTYDDNTKSTVTEEVSTSESNADLSSEKNTELLTKTESSSTTETIISSTDEITTETTSEVPSTTELQCVCPKVEPPPILILEGEVIEIELNLR